MEYIFYILCFLAYLALGDMVKNKLFHRNSIDPLWPITIIVLAIYAVIFKLEQYNEPKIPQAN